MNTHIRMDRAALYGALFGPLALIILSVILQDPMPGLIGYLGGGAIVGALLFMAGAAIRNSVTR